MYPETPLQRLVNFYLELQEAVSSGRITLTQAEAQLAGANVPDASGAIWSLNIDGQFLRSLGGAPPVVVDPEQYVAPGAPAPIAPVPPSSPVMPAGTGAGIFPAAAAVPVSSPAPSVDDLFGPDDTSSGGGWNPASTSGPWGSAAPAQAAPAGGPWTPSSTPAPVSPSVFGLPETPAGALRMPDGAELVTDAKPGLLARFRKPATPASSLAVPADAPPKAGLVATLVKQKTNIALALMAAALLYVGFNQNSGGTQLPIEPGPTTSPTAAATQPTAPLPSDTPTAAPVAKGPGETDSTTVLAGLTSGLPAASEAVKGTADQKSLAVIAGASKIGASVTLSAPAKKGTGWVSTLKVAGADGAAIASAVVVWTSDAGTWKLASIPAL